MRSVVSLVIAVLLLAACVPIPAAPAAEAEPPPVAPTEARAATAIPKPTAAPTQPPEPTAAPEPSPAGGEAALHLGWTWPGGDGALLRLLAVDGAGMSYVADQEGVLHGVVAPGEALWSVVSVCGNALPPALSPDDATLYFVGFTEEDETSVCAVTPDGRPLWNTPVEGLTQYVPTVAPDGSLHLSTETGILRITPDGEATEHALPAEATGSAIRQDMWPTVDDAGNSYYVNTLNSQVIVVSPEFETRAECAVGRGPAGVMGALRGGEGESGAEDQPTKMVNVWVSDPIARADEGFVVAADPGVISAYDADCNELWQYGVFESEEPGDRLALAGGPDGAIYAGGPGGLLLKLSADGELAWRNERVEGAPLVAILKIGDDGAIAALGDNPPTLLAYTAGGEQTLSERLYQLDNTGYPVPMPGGAVAQIQQGKLKVYTSDPALVVAAEPAAAPPADRAAAEAEITDFMVDVIVNEDIEATLQYIEESGWAGGPAPTENLIVWTTPLPEPESAAEETITVMLWDESTQSYRQEERPVREEDRTEPAWPKLDEENPLKVWAYNADGLAEIEGDTAARLAAIEAYHTEHMPKEVGRDIFAWGFYQFAITSLDASLQKAQVYRAASCGLVCGSGYLLTLERTPDGEWIITDAEHLWQS